MSTLDSTMREMAEKRLQAEADTVREALARGYKAVIPGHWCLWPDSRGERATLIFDGSPFYGTGELQYGDTVAVMHTACNRETRDGRSVFVLKTGIESVWMVDKEPSYRPHESARYEVVRLAVNPEIATGYYAPSQSR